jgi:hypothetical protein
MDARGDKDTSILQADEARGGIFAEVLATW